MDPAAKHDRKSTATFRSYAAAYAPELDYASQAPEYDHTLRAPEHRGENPLPEVDPGRGIQVFYDNHPPEAVEIKSTSSSEDVADPPTIDALSIRRNRKRRLTLILLAIVIIVAALGIGLGVGLRRQMDENNNARLSSSPTVPSNSTTATVSVAAQPSATDGVIKSISKHAMMDNTSLAAVTLPNGRRQVYFQDRTGALRRAVSSSQINVWQASIDPQQKDSPEMIPVAKNNTPLAAVPGLLDHEGGTIFYVRALNNKLGCSHFSSDGFVDCKINLPDVAVSPDSRQLSATLLVSKSVNLTDDDQRLLLSYEDTSRNLVILFGFKDETLLEGNLWAWKDKTAIFNAALSKVYFNPKPGDTIDYIGQDYHLATTCAPGVEERNTVTPLSPPDTSVDTSQIDKSGDRWLMYCFVRKTDNKSSQSHDGGVAILEFFTNKTGQSNLFLDTVNMGNELSWNEPTPMPISDIASLAQGRATWFNKTGFSVSYLTGAETLPSPKSGFPFARLASTFTDNKYNTSTYLYHQLSESVIVEDLWDTTSGFWISTNITIET